MKEAKNFTEAQKLFNEHEGNKGFIQWKGTDVCMDFHCECGEHNHYDGYFAYEIQCAKCKATYAPSCHVEIVKIEESNDPLESVFNE